MDTKRHSENKKVSLQDKVLGQILTMMEGGKIPWHCPWKRRDQMPINLFTGEKYHGFNSFWLGLLGGGSKYWLGMQQANQLGGRIRKGEAGTPIIFPRLEKMTKKNAEGEEQEGVALLGFSGGYVWNLNQIDGITAPTEAEYEEKEFNPIQAAEKIIEQMPQRPEIRYSGSSAHYRPSTDLIQLPLIADFESESEYYSTIYHELAHASGHSTRLNRKGITDPARFGSHEYSKEELIAEFASSYLCAEAGIERGTIKNSAAYIQNWARVLKADKTMIFFAAAQAEKAAKYILNVKDEVAEEAEPQQAAA